MLAVVAGGKLDKMSKNEFLFCSQFLSYDKDIADLNSHELFKSRYINHVAKFAVCLKEKKIQL